MRSRDESHDTGKAPFWLLIKGPIKQSHVLQFNDFGWKQPVSEAEQSLAFVASVKLK